MISVFTYSFVSFPYCQCCTGSDLAPSHTLQRTSTSPDLFCTKSISTELSTYVHTHVQPYVRTLISTRIL